MASDKERLDWLECMAVNVRLPLVYGSRDLWWASPEDGEGESWPSDIRAKIDAEMLLHPIPDYMAPHPFRPAPTTKGDGDE